jgi:hypothetical protein
MNTVVDASGKCFRTESGKDYGMDLFCTPWDYREFINVLQNSVPAIN